MCEAVLYKRYAHDVISSPGYITISGVGGGEISKISDKS